MFKKVFFDVGVLPVGKVCNLKCRHCFESTHQFKEYIDPFNPLFDYLSQLGLKKCFIGGGEPFLHPQMIEVIRKLSKKIAIRYLLTNGLRLQKNLEPLDGLIETLVISVDKMHEEAALRQRKEMNYLNEIFFKIKKFDIHNKVRINSVISKNDLSYLFLIRDKISCVKKIKDWHIYPMTPAKLSIS